jgi:hypothetical protein
VLFSKLCQFQQALTDATAPVGLLGKLIMIARVRGVMAFLMAAMFSRNSLPYRSALPPARHPPGKPQAGKKQNRSGNDDLISIFQNSIGGQIKRLRTADGDDDLM